MQIPTTVCISYYLEVLILSSVSHPERFWAKKCFYFYRKNRIVMKIEFFDHDNRQKVIVDAICSQLFALKNALVTSIS